MFYSPSLFRVLLSAYCSGQSFVSQIVSSVNITLTLKTITAQVVEMLVTVTNSSFQNYTHPDNHTRQTADTPGFKPFTMYYFMF